MSKVIECLQKYYGRTEEEWQAKLDGIKIKNEEKMTHEISFVMSRFFPYTNNAIGERESPIFGFNLTRDIQSILMDPLESYLLAIFAGDLKYFEKISESQEEVANAAGAFACLIGNYEIARFIFNQVPESSPKKGANRAEALFHCSLFNEDINSAMEWVSELAQKYAIDISKFSPEFYNDADRLEPQWSMAFEIIERNYKKEISSSLEEKEELNKYSKNKLGNFLDFFSPKELREKGYSSSAPETPTKKEGESCRRMRRSN